MTADQLRGLTTARPFVPFTIRTADGRAVEVRDPEAIAFGDGLVALVVTPDGRPEVIDLLLVPSPEASGRGPEGGGSK